MNIVWERYRDIERLQHGLSILVVSSEILDDLHIEVDSNHTLWKIFLSIENLISTFHHANFMVKVYNSIISIFTPLSICCN
jgi:hypothetical protein